MFNVHETVEDSHAHYAHYLHFLLFTLLMTRTVPLVSTPERMRRWSTAWLRRQNGVG